MKTNCVNCGAPLEGRKCKYCGTVYRDNKVHATFDEGSWTGTLEIGNTQFAVYLSEVQVEMLQGVNIGRTLDGRVVADPTRLTHKFTLVEM